MASVENFTEADDTKSCLAKRAPAAMTRQNYLKNCSFCGGKKHIKSKDCPAFDEICSYYTKLNHFEPMCFAKKKDLTAKTNQTLSTILSYNESLFGLASLKINNVIFYNVLIALKFNDVLITALLRILVTLLVTTFVRVRCAKSRNLLVTSASKAVRMADYSKLSRLMGMLKYTITLHNPIINNICLFVLKSLISDLTIETDFEERFNSFTLAIID